jgi:negative regulator of genetic competence, sporulation and motility
VVVHEATLGKWWSLGDLSDVDVTKAEIFYDANGMRHNLFVSLLSAQEDLPYFADTFIEIPVTPDSYSSIRSIYNVAKEQVLHLNKLNNNKIKIYTNNGIQVN